MLILSYLFNLIAHNMAISKLINTLDHGNSRQGETSKSNRCGQKDSNLVFFILLKQMKGGREEINERKRKHFNEILVHSNNLSAHPVLFPGLKKFFFKKKSTIFQTWHMLLTFKCTFQLYLLKFYNQEK